MCIRDSIITALHASWRIGQQRSSSTLNVTGQPLDGAPAVVHLLHYLPLPQFFAKLSLVNRCPHVCCYLSSAVVVQLTDHYTDKTWTWHIRMFIIYDIILLLFSDDMVLHKASQKSSKKIWAVYWTTIRTRSELDKFIRLSLPIYFFLVLGDYVVPHKASEKSTQPIGIWNLHFTGDPHTRWWIAKSSGSKPCRSRQPGTPRLPWAWRTSRAIVTFSTNLSSLHSPLATCCIIKSLPSPVVLAQPNNPRHQSCQRTWSARLR